MTEPTKPVPQMERPLEKDLLAPYFSKPAVRESFRKLFPEQATHFNKLHYMVMRNLLLRTGCGPSDNQVRELLTYMAELGIVSFKDDMASFLPPASM